MLFLIIAIYWLLKKILLVFIYIIFIYIREINNLILLGNIYLDNKNISVEIITKVKKIWFI